MDKKNKNNIAKILLAFGVLASPVMLANQVSADNSIGNSIGNTTDTNKIQQNTESDTATTYNVIKENKEEKEQAKEVVSTAAENNKADATKEATTTKDTAIETTETTSQKEEATEEKEEAVIEGKEAFKLTDSQRQALKNASFTDGEIAKIEEDIANSLAENPNIDVDAKLNKKIQEANAKEANSLEVAPEGEKASQKAGKGQQVNNKVHVSNINIQYKDGGSQKEEVWVTSAGHAAFTADYKVDDDVKSGDYFTVSYGDNVVPGLVNEPRTATNLMDARGRMIAQGIYDKDSNTTTYTFTDYVDIFNNVRGSFQQSLWPVREQITDDGQKVDVTITVADETKTRNMTFQYGNKKYLPITETITSVNREENTVHTTTYINQSGDRIGGLNKIKLESNNYEYTDPSQVKIYEVSNNAVFRDSFSPNLAAGAKEVTDLPITVENGIAYIDVGTKLNMKTKYVVLGTPTLKKDADPNKAVKVTSSVVNKNNGQVVVDNHGQTVSHTSALLQAGDTSTGEGDQEEQPGSFQEHHIYLTKDKDGNVIEEKTIKKDGETTKGSKTEFYKTGKKEEDGYTFVRTENPVNNPIYNNDGSKSAGNYVPGVKQEITYVYEKTVDEPAEEPGSFQEHHIYITKDEDGNIIEEKTIKEDGKVKEGTKDETYPTGKNEKDGYTFVRTENPVNEPTYNEDGTPTEGNFKPGEKQEITYVYEKTITTKGSFQDHHIYQTVDKNGKVISTDDNKDGKEQTGKENEKYTTNKIDKEGYKLVEVKPTNDKSKELGVKYDSENGEPTKGNYVAGEKQEVTYIYQRTKEEPGSFQEHHIYITKDEDGNIIEEKTIKEDGKVKEGTKDETYPTGKNEKDGYTFVRTENPVNEPTYNEDGTPTEGNFKPGEKQEITYVYEKTITTKGSFQDHHIYQTVDKNGKVISTDDNKDGKEQTGKENEKYTTNKIDKEGYKLVEVKPTNDKSKELGVKYDSENGEPTKGNYVAGEKQEVTYIYQRTKEEPTEEKGSFQEHHIYQTVDKNGKVISTDETKDKDVTEGTEKENYKTSKEDKDGYKLVKIESKNGGKFNEDGSEKEAAYIANTKQEVTYIYQRTKEEPTEEKGSFQEHHIYQTVDKNGKVISTDETKDKDVTEGTEKENYKTSKEDKDGYKLVKIESKNGGKFNEDGSEKEAAYIANTKQEVTYIYQKEEQPVEKKGSFQEHHIYQTKKLDGTIVKDDEVNKDVTEGTEKENYKTSKEDRDGYKLIEVKSVNGGQFNKDGSKKEAAYIADTKQEVTYIYQKEEQPVEKKGSFQEHHIYQTKKLDGTIVKDDEVNKDVTEGTEKENYKTSKEDRDGYKLIEVKSVNGGQFNKDGSEKEAAYIADTKQEVTYIYQKEEQPVEKKGSFQEHHIYQTKKLDGTIVKDDEVNKDVTEGTEKENYKTSKEDRDGYKLIEVKSVNGGQFNKDGSEKEAAYIADTKQEVTYIYQKEEQPVEKKGSFQEHHIYITKDKDGKEIKREVVDGDVSGGTKDMTYTTGKAEKDGFKFVRTEDAKENPSYDKDGKETKSNFKPGVKQEITYVYEKTEIEWTPLEETGKFQEHHIYITKDKDGKEIKREVVDGDVSGGTKDMTYTTGKAEKDGFKFVRTEDAKENPSYDKDGKETKGNFKPGVKQEITYVYEKTETPWTPLEPSEPVTPVEPEQPGTPEQPNKPVRQSKKLPKAGADYELLKLAAGALSIVSGFGLSLGRKKED